MMAGVAEPVTGQSDTKIGAEGLVGNSVGMAVTDIFIIYQHSQQIITDSTPLCAISIPCK